MSLISFFHFWTCNTCYQAKLFYEQCTFWNLNYFVWNIQHFPCMSLIIYISVLQIIEWLSRKTPVGHNCPSYMHTYIFGLSWLIKSPSIPCWHHSSSWPRTSEPGLSERCDKERMAPLVCILWWLPFKWNHNTFGGSATFN